MAGQVPTEAVTDEMVHALFVVSVAVYVSDTLPIVQLFDVAVVVPTVAFVVVSMTVTLSPFGLDRLIACDEPLPVMDKDGGVVQDCCVCVAEILIFPITCASYRCTPSIK